MSDSDKLKILECFPDARDVNVIRQELGMKPREDSHSMYLLHKWTRDRVVEVLKGLGATVKKSACCMEIIENGEIFSRLKELPTKFGEHTILADCRKYQIRTFGCTYRRFQMVSVGDRINLSTM